YRSAHHRYLHSFPTRRSSDLFTALADQFIIGIWPFYALAVAGVYVLRRTRPQLERPYRTWGYPVVPVVFLVAALFLLGHEKHDRSEEHTSELQSRGHLVCRLL